MSWWNILVPIAIAAGGRLIIDLHANAQEKYVPEKRMRTSRAYWAISILLTVISICLMVFSIRVLRGFHFGMWAFFAFGGAGVLLGLILLTACLNLSVTVESNGIVYRNFFRKTYNIPYVSIRHYKINPRTFAAIIVYTCEKKYNFGDFLIGFSYLCEQIKLHAEEHKVGHSAL